MDVQTTHSLTSAADLWGCLELDLPEVFTTADLATGGAMPRWLAQKAAWCFRQMNYIEPCGKQGNAIEYRLTTVPEKSRTKAA